MAGVPVLTSELAVFREQLADAGWVRAFRRCAGLGPSDGPGIRRVRAGSARGSVAGAGAEQAWKDFSETSRQLFSCR